MRVLLVPNVGNPASISATAEIATWLAAQDIEPVLDMSDASSCGLVDFGVEPFEVGEPGLAIALGGDGTILKAVHVLGDIEVPILGVNMGRLGFLTAAGPDQAREAIAAALAGDVRVERRATIRVRARHAGGQVEFRALNEIFVGRSQVARVVGVSLSIDGALISRFRADGLIVATATGSTAYAMSAGGPIVAPGFGGMIVVPVAPHTLASRSILTDANDTVLIEFDPLRSDSCMTIDGRAAACPDTVTSIEVSRHDVDALLVRVDHRGFYDAVATEFFGD